MGSAVNILLVDDRADNRLALKAILESPDYQLLEASNGPDALRMLLDHDIAVLLLDVRMPGMDGFELAAIVRSRAKTRWIPILFLTAEAPDPASMFRGYSLGAFDYLVKPLVAEFVRAKVAVFADLYRMRRRIEEQTAQLLLVERREASLRLREQRAAAQLRYQHLADAVPHIVWTAKPDGTIDYFNQRWFEATGVERDQNAPGWLDELHPEDRPNIEAQWQSALLEGTPLEFEARLRSQLLGEYRWHLGRVIPEFDRAGKLASWLGTLTDIEQQKRAQNVLSEFKATLDAVIDAVFIFDPLSWRVKYLNQGASALLQLSPDQLKQMRTLDLLPEYSESEFRELLDALQRGHLPSVAIETRVRRQDRDDVPVELSLQHIEINGGRLVGIGRDITERKRAEAERDLLYHEALDAIRARDEFLSIASHELKTPLTSLRLQLDNLRRLNPVATAQGVSGTAEEKLSAATRQISRLARLIEELLDVSRIGSGVFRIEPSANVDLAAIVSKVVKRYQVELAQSGCEVKLHLPEEPVRGIWDRARVEEVVSNLISNAMKFGPNRPIEVTVREVNGVAELAVRDHGIGIPPEARERIFGRFERGVSSRNYGGLGLGLYIVRQILNAHGGRVHVEDGEGEGSKFVVELPKSPPGRGEHAPLH